MEQISVALAAPFFKRIGKVFIENKLKKNHVKDIQKVRFFTVSIR
jgi:hypothetical protein